MAQVGGRVDARDDQVDLFSSEEAQQSQRYAVRRGAIAGESLAAICQLDLCDAQRAIQGLDMSAARPVAVGRQDADFAQCAHFLHQRQQPGGQYAIIVCDEYMHGNTILLPKPFGMLLEYLIFHRITELF